MTGKQIAAMATSEQQLSKAGDGEFLFPEFSHGGICSVHRKRHSRHIKSNIRPLFGKINKKIST